jgi:hypothetical protein
MTITGPDNYREAVARDAPLEGITSLNPNKSQGNQFGVQYLKANDVPGGINVNDWATALQDFNTNQAKGPWTIKFMGTALDSTLHIINYMAAKKVGDRYGGILDLTFTLKDPNISINDVRIVQKISTNKPNPNIPPLGTFTPDNYLDPRPGDDIKQGDKEELPFYYTMAEDPGQKDVANKVYSYHDFSDRNFDPGTYWTADLMFAVWANNRDANGFVTSREVDIYDGIRWGWVMNVPEPSSVVLFTMGSVMLGIRLVRRQRPPLAVA